MPIYEWICQECNIYWERECSIAKAPDRTRCPQCRKLSERYYANQNVQHKWGDDKDFHTVRARHQKHAQKGFDKTAGDRFLNQSIESTKNAMNDESYRYKSMNIDWKKLGEDRGLRRVSEAEAMQKIENAKNLTGQAYDNANKMGYKDIGSTKLDINKPKKQS